jgi:hypothetical protein
MRFHPIFICFILFCVTSCKKNHDSTPTYSISADIDGVQESFNTRPTGELNTDAAITIFGSNGDIASSDVISITIVSDTAIAAGTYSSNEGDVFITYKNGVSTAENTNTYVSQVGSEPTTITVTKLSSSNIEGTFSGKLFYNGARKTIANGKFNVTLIK